jgi:hypothetical protein
MFRFSINILTSKYIFLLILLLFNFNIFFKLPIDKIFYFPVLALIFISVAFHFIKSIILNELISFKSLLTFTILIGFVFFRFNVFSLSAHYIYASTFSLAVLFLYYQLNFKLPHSDFTNFYHFLKLVISVTLIVTLIHLGLNLGASNRGWVWPVNIALQELVIINLLFCQILYFGIRKSLLNISLFLILVLFRESGKAALFSFGLFTLIYIVKFSDKSKIFFFNTLLKIVILVNFTILFFGVILLSDTTSLLKKGSALDYIFSKRFLLIKQSFDKISEGTNFLFGGGFGTENYLSDSKLIINNTPQFLILTMSVYGGFVFSVFFFYLIFSLRKKLIEISGNNTRINFLIYAYFFVILFMLSFHEYFNNPILIFSISLTLFSIKSTSLNYE